jgi:signal peptidase II
MNFKNMIALVVALVGLDQGVKYLVETNLTFQTLVDVLPFLGLYRTWNEGVAFSLLWGLDDRALIIGTSLIVLFVGWLAYRTNPSNWLARLGFTLIIGGAIGNLIDRVTLGHVVDYVLFHTPIWSFAVFNLADSFISIGAALIVLEEFLSWRKATPKAD